MRDGVGPSSITIPCQKQNCIIFVRFATAHRYVSGFIPACSFSSVDVGKIKLTSPLQFETTPRMGFSPFGMC